MLSINLMRFDVMVYMFPSSMAQSICHTRCSCNALYNWNANETHKHVLVAYFQESFLNVLYKEKAK